MGTTFYNHYILCGFPIALILAWIFELTPEGIKKTVEVVPDESISVSVGKKINKIIIGGLTLVILLLLAERFFIAPKTLATRAQTKTLESIAVLPFADLSPSGDQEYFSDGLSEELINVLTQVKGLKVPGRTSSFKFKGQNDDLKKIGEELGVNHILEGSVRKSGNQIRITAQLIKVKDGFHMWSTNYDRKYSAENLFKIQDDISKKVCNELIQRLLPSDRTCDTFIRPTENTLAYDYFLRANQLLRNRNSANIVSAINLLKRAVEEDSSFAEGYSRLAMAYAHQYEYGSINRDSVAELIGDNAWKANYLDNNLAEAYAGLGEYYELKGENDKRRDAFKKAYELNPKNPEIITWYANCLPWDTDKELRFKLRQDAYEIDPLSPIVINSLATEYLLKNEKEKALELYDENIRQNPDYVGSYSRKVNLLKGEGYGQLDRAFIQAYEAYLAHPENVQLIMSLSYCAASFGFTFVTEELEEKMKILYPENKFYKSIRFNNLIRSGDLVKAYAIYEPTRASDDSETGMTLSQFSAQVREFIEKGQLDSALELVKSEQPSYLSDTITKHPHSYLETTYVKYLFNKKNLKNERDRLTKIPCDFGQDSLRFDGDLSKESSATLMRYKNCAVFRDDSELFGNILNELYFNRKKKTIGGFYEHYQVVYEDIKTDYIASEVFGRVEDDMQKMKINAIDYLKSVDKWPSELIE